jgi:hypothetical protein
MKKITSNDTKQSTLKYYHVLPMSQLYQVGMPEEVMERLGFDESGFTGSFANQANESTNPWD